MEKNIKKQKSAKNTLITKRLNEVFSFDVLSKDMWNYIFNNKKLSMKDNCSKNERN